MDADLLVPIFGIMGFFGSITAFIYMYFKTKHEQRMALIDSGQSAGIFNEKENYNSGLRTGLFFIGIGIGFIVGITLEQNFGFPDATGVIPMCFIGGGIGLVINHLMQKKSKATS